MSLSQIVNSLNLPCISQTAHNVLGSNRRAKYVKLRSCLSLTKQHKLARVQFAKKYILFGAKWKEVIFSDEKKN